MNTNLRLKSIGIRIQESYESYPGQYTGSVVFDDSEHSNEIKLFLTEKLCNSILEVVADELVYAAKLVAEELTANCINMVSNNKTKALDNKTDDE